MANFEASYARVLGYEGGYSNHSADRGGETYKGVARNIYPDWPGWRIVDDCKTRPGFPRSLDGDAELARLVREFYKANSWDRFHGDSIPSDAVAGELLDIAVNMGQGVAASFVQRCLNVMNKQGTLYPDIAADGRYGDQTHNTLLKFLSIHPDNGALLVKMLNSLQGARYIQIMENNPSQEAFAYGWFTRV